MQYQAQQTQHIDRLAKVSLYQANHNLKIEAELQLTTILLQMPLGNYDQLLEFCSEEAVLAVAAILRKNLANIRQDTLRYTMLKINQVLARWYSPRGVLVRPYKGDLKPYILNTFGQFMGNCMKVLYSSVQGKRTVNELLNFFASLPHYQLFLYFSFIQSVSIIDGDTKYVSHRTLLTSFQQTLIPRIFEALYPYFMSISDSMEVAQLTFLQSQLTVNQTSFQSRQQFNLSFEKQKNAFTELVFKLLEQLISFRFNLSHRQYENSDDFSSIMISFPQSLLSKIIRQNFLNALYNILMQLMRTNQTKYQEICLNCLKKILLAKITYISKDMQTRFIINNLEGVLKLLQLISNQINKCLRNNIVHILQCNINFLITFGLDSIIEFTGKNERSKQFLNKWIELTAFIPVYLIQNQNMPINFENEVFLVGSEMLISLANQFKLIKYDQTIFIDLYRRYTKKFLELFIVNGTNINGSKMLSVDEFKNSCEFLSRVKIIMTFNYRQLFLTFNECCNMLFMQDSQQFPIGNFILLLRETIRENNFLQESIIGNGLIKTQSRQMQVESVQQLKMFGFILSRTIQFILTYLNNISSQFGYVNNAMIFFLATLLDRCSKKISLGDDPQKPIKPFIDYQVFRCIRLNFQDITDENFLQLCLNALTCFTSIPGISSFEFIFNILHQTVTQIKYSMKRQNFKSSLIYKEMGKFFERICQQPISLQFMKSRISLFKTITTLSFDDSLDQYRISIKVVISLLKKSASQGQWVNFLYDLTGILQTIQNQPIFRYFIRWLAREIIFSDIIQNLFSLAFGEPNIYLRDVLHLSWMFTSNLCNRVGSGLAMQNVYDILIHVLPYWNKYLEHALHLNQQAMNEMYLIVIAILNEEHINICILEKAAPDSFRHFIKLTISSMQKVIQDIQSCPQLGKSLFKLSLLLTQKVAKPLFNSQDFKIAYQINELINVLIRKLTLSFQIITNGAFQQKIMTPILETINQYYMFIRKNKKIKHLVYLCNNINSVLLDTRYKQEFLLAIIKIAMEFRQHFQDTIDHIATISVNIIEYYKINAESVVGQLGLDDQHDVKQFIRIFDSIRNQTEDNQWLTSQMKDWLKNKSRFCGPIDNDY